MDRPPGGRVAWATRLVAKEAQAWFSTRTHHLRRRCEQGWAHRHGVRKEAEARRRTQRAARAEPACAKHATPWSTRVRHARLATPRSVKFIRGLPCRQSWHANAAETTASLRRKPFQATS